MIRPKADIYGTKSVVDLFPDMADKKGRRWMKNAYLKAGREAFNKTVTKARRLMPTKSGLAARSITRTKGNFNANALKAVNPSTASKGFIPRAKKSRYTIDLTLSKDWNERYYATHPTYTRKDRAPRYPFILNVGGKAGKTWSRTYKSGKQGTVTRRNTLNAGEFFYRAIAQTESQVVQKFQNDMYRYMRLYYTGQYGSLTKAVKANRNAPPDERI